MTADRTAGKNSFYRQTTNDKDLASVYKMSTGVVNNRSRRLDRNINTIVSVSTTTKDCNDSLEENNQRLVANVIMGE